MIGALVGITAGYFGGWIDRILTLIDDWFLVIPFVPLAIVLVGLLQETRSQNLPVRADRDHHLRARHHRVGGHVTDHPRAGAVGEGTPVRRARALDRRLQRYIMRKHILPNVLPLVFANTVLIVSLAILGEAAVVPRPRRPSPRSRGAACSTTPTGGRAVAGRLVVRAAARHLHQPSSCWRFSMVGYAIEEIVNPRLKERS